MRNLAIFNSPILKFQHPDNIITSIEMEGVRFCGGLLHTDDIEFDATSPDNQFKVLVKKRAFSCNYRDKGIILKAATYVPEDRFYSIGSDFVAEVVACGTSVTEMRVGDRVIGNNCYPDSGVADLRPGVPTNQASKEFQIFHQAKLLKIPPSISDTVAAGFSIGAQTAYSMIRKLDVKPGDNVLVTAAKSNTSLFVINALRHLDVNLYGLSTSRQFEDQLHQMGVKQLITINPDDPETFKSSAVVDMLRKTGGLDHIIDPFFDLHIGKVLSWLIPGEGGKYITCGLYEQYSQFTDAPFTYRGLSLSRLMTHVMMNNIQLIGNCVGKTHDLQQAIQDCAKGKFPVTVDSYFSGAQIEDFFYRTYMDRDRFGKVIFLYD